MAGVPTKRMVDSPVKPKTTHAIDPGTDSRVPVTKKNPGQARQPRGVPPGPHPKG